MAEQFDRDAGYELAPRPDGQGVGGGQGATAEHRLGAKAGAYQQVMLNAVGHDGIDRLAQQPPNAEHPRGPAVGGRQFGRQGWPRATMLAPWSA